jgi:glycine hydroxymethyltransferase
MASLLLGKKKKKKVVVFLCTGNTCRGPMAQGYMKAAIEERGIKEIEVRTAGVMTIPGLIPTQEAVLVLKNAGIDITSHRSSPLTHELIRKSDLILGMTPFHVQYALRMSDEAKGKTYLLKEFAESDVKNYQISDPMGMTLEVYKRVYREMKLAIDRMLDNKEFFTGQSAPPPPVKEPEPKKVEKKKPAKKKPAAKKPTSVASGS